MTVATEAARIRHELVRGDNGPDPFSAAVRATRMPMVITNPRLADNPIVFVNAAFCRLTGFSPDEIIGRNCRFLQGPGTDRADVARLQTAIARRQAIELDLYNYTKDGTPFWNRLLVSPVFDDDGQLTYFFASQFDVTLERQRLADLQQDHDSLTLAYGEQLRELEASESRLRFALKAGRLGSWSRDLATDTLSMSDGCRAMFGLAETEDVTFDSLKAAIHPDDRPRYQAAVEATIGDRSDLDVEFRILTPRSEERWLQAKGQANYRADGTPLALVGVLQDVTDRKHAEDHRTLLSNELSHRIKNTLATMQAIIGQTLRKAESLSEASDTLTARIQSMAAANDLLTDGRWESAGVQDLLHRTLAPFGVDDASRFDLAGPPVKVPPRVAVALALGIHELATNASKYGGLSNAGGRVRVRWDIPDQSQRVLQFRWEEQGGPPVAAPTRTGFGTKLIERVLAQETGGSAAIAYEPHGVVFEASLPIPDGELRDQRAG